MNYYALAIKLWQLKKTEKINMRILFTTSAAPNHGPFFTGEKRPPLGQGTLLSLARDNGHQVFFIDNYLRQSYFLEHGYLQRHNIDYFGIYANTICFSDTLRMIHYANDLRKKGKWTGKIIVGGPHTSVGIETIPACVDYIVQGEGEQAILDILSGTEKRRIIKNKPLKDINFLPYEPWDIFTKMKYDFSSPFSKAYPTFTLNTSRGCPFHCAFCSVDSIWGNQYTYYSAERIYDEVSFLVKNYNAKGIYFREDNFTLNKSRVVNFCELLIKNNFKIDWACETRVESLCDEEFVRLLHKARCKGVYLGVESVNENVLRRINKHINREQIETCIRLCKKHKINTYCSLITGLPGETYEEYKETKDFIEKIKPHSYAFNVFVGIPTSSLYNEIKYNHLYEYKDKLNMLYLPGYNIKTRFFYGKSIPIDNYRFSLKNWTEYDWKIFVDLCKKESYELINKTIKNTFLRLGN